jgi:hypothetical protein
MQCGDADGDGGDSRSIAHSRSPECPNFLLPCHDDGFLVAAFIQRNDMKDLDLYEYHDCSEACAVVQEPQSPLTSLSILSIKFLHSIVL